MKKIKDVLKGLLVLIIVGEISTVLGWFMKKEMQNTQFHPVIFSLSLIGAIAVIVALGFFLIWLLWED